MTGEMTIRALARAAQASASWRALAGLFLLVALLQESDTDLVAVDPGELAAPVGQTGGRQQQEEFLQVSLRRSRRR